jgi:cytochrome c oxidase subunit 2
MMSDSRCRRCVFGAPEWHASQFTAHHACVALGSVGACVVDQQQQSARQWWRVSSQWCWRRALQLAVDLSASAANGLKLSQNNGCASCHGTDFGGGTGPTWQGIIGQTVAFKGGESGVVDREYLTEAIKYPDKKKRVGYSVVMPYNNLTDAEISDIVDYIEALSN